jgi:hypothetical protein
MKYAEVEPALQAGMKIKLSPWKNAYWYMKDGVLVNHDERGFECPAKELFPHDFMWVMSDKWEVIGEENPYENNPLYCSFGIALVHLKKGEKVARKGWNGKGQYIQLASNISYTTADGKVVNCDHDAIGNQAIAFVGTSGVQMGWLASQADMLAEDWYILND